MSIVKFPAKFCKNKWLKKRFLLLILGLLIKKKGMVDTPEFLYKKEKERKRGKKGD